MLCYFILCTSTESKFITTETRCAMRKRDRLKKKFNKSRDPTDWENYRQMRNRVVNMRRKAVQEHFSKLCEDKRGNQRKFWSTIRPYINSRKCNTLVNYVLDTAKIPQQWKLGEVSPVHKKNCGLDKSNYRPLTILPSLSKVSLGTLNARVSPHFERIYRKYVFAYSITVAIPPYSVYHRNGRRNLTTTTSSD